MIGVVTDVAPSALADPGVASPQGPPGHGDQHTRPEHGDGGAPDNRDDGTDFLDGVFVAHVVD